MENKQFLLFPPEAEQTEHRVGENWQQSIPAQVFLNHYFAINYHIQQDAEAYKLYNLPHFVSFKPELSEEQKAQIKKYLLNSWNTEYALRTTGSLGDEEYLRNALHWTFPQAYYSIFSGLQAFLVTKGIDSSNQELVRREVGRMVVQHVYPNPVAFYAAGHYGDFRVHRLPLGHYKPSLNVPQKEIEAQAQIGQFLRTTRKLRAKGVRQRVQSNPATAIRSARTGEVLQKFSNQHWEQLTWRIGYTTFFDLLGRLRISANHREIERFVASDIDFQLFHQTLLDIVSYLNFVHEAYVAQALGLQAYRELVAQLPKYLQDSFVTERLHEKIAPIIQVLHPEGDQVQLPGDMGMAA